MSEKTDWRTSFATRERAEQVLEIILLDTRGVRPPTWAEGYPKVEEIEGGRFRVAFGNNLSLSVR